MKYKNSLCNNFKIKIWMRVVKILEIVEVYQKKIKKNKENDIISFEVHY